jgi:hypothetical protein
VRWRVVADCGVVVADAVAGAAEVPAAVVGVGRETDLEVHAVKAKSSAVASPRVKRFAFGSNAGRGQNRRRADGRFLPAPGSHRIATWPAYGMASEAHGKTHTEART